MKLGMKVLNRIIVKLTKLQAFTFCIGIRPAPPPPPPILNRVKDLSTKVKTKSSDLISHSIPRIFLVTFTLPVPSFSLK